MPTRIPNGEVRGIDNYGQLLINECNLSFGISCNNAIYIVLFDLICVDMCKMTK